MVGWQVVGGTSLTSGCRNFIANVGAAHRGGKDRSLWPRLAASPYQTAVLAGAPHPHTTPDGGGRHPPPRRQPRVTVPRGRPPSTSDSPPSCAPHPRTTSLSRYALLGQTTEQSGHGHPLPLCSDASLSPPTPPPPPTPPTLLPPPPTAVKLITLAARWHSGSYPTCRWVGGGGGARVERASAAAHAPLPIPSAIPRASDILPPRHTTPRHPSPSPQTPLHHGF